MMPTTTPPIDVNNEAYAAQLALKRCRAKIEQAALPIDWELWVARSLLAGYEAQKRTADEDEA